MREILFRGKRKDNGKWIYDSETYIRDGDGMWLSDENLNVVKVQEDTLGQYTGLTDKNGVKIFEGDIVKHLRTCELYAIAWHGSFAEFVISELPKPNKTTRKCKDMYLVNRYYEVIGNIYDKRRKSDNEIFRSIKNCR